MPPEALVHNVGFVRQNLSWLGPCTLVWPYFWAPSPFLLCVFLGFLWLGNSDVMSFKLVGAMPRARDSNFHLCRSWG